MPRKYQVESKLPDPVFIQTLAIKRILSEDEYRSYIKPIENYDAAADEEFHRPTTGWSGRQIFGEFEPRVQLRSNFFDIYTPVELETGDIIPLEKTSDREFQVGDYLSYDIRWDAMRLFDEKNYPSKLTLIESE